MLSTKAVAVKQLVKPGKLINLPELNYKLTGHYSAPMKPEDVGAGRTFIPPCTLNMKNPAPKKAMTMTASESAALPSAFSWHDDQLVTQYKGDDYVNCIMEPLDQNTCGSCYAFATTSALSDRIAVGLKGKGNPQLGATYLLSCGVTGNCNSDPTDPSRPLQGCNGGMIFAALQAMANPAGTVPKSCWSYQWCTDGCQGETDGNVLNGKIPPFSDNTKCISDPNEQPALYKVTPGTTKTLTSIDQIKQSIFTNGPLPAGYFVYTDFFLGTQPASQGGDGWAKTNGIYVHLETDNNGKTPNGDPIVYNYGNGGAPSMNTLAGAHAVVIVGWGVQDVPNFLTVSYPEKKTLTLPYWIVRNSWSDKWNEGGYFRIAMTDGKNYINSNVLLDSSAPGGVGGVIEFMPDLKSAPPIPAPAGGWGSTGKSGSSKGWLLILLIVALLAVGGWWLWKRYR